MAESDAWNIDETDSGLSFVLYYLDIFWEQYMTADDVLMKFMSKSSVYFEGLCFNYSCKMDMPHIM